MGQLIRFLANWVRFGQKTQISEISLREIDPPRDSARINRWFELDQKGFMDAYPYYLRIKLFKVIVGKFHDGKEESIGLIGIFDQLGEDELFIYVDSRARDQGIGKKALQLLLADPRCPKTLRAATGEKNFSCQRLLEQSGFSKIGSDKLRDHMITYQLFREP